MRIIVIGATGHIGSALVPQLVKQGLEVVAVSRQQRNPYQLDPTWKQVQTVSLDRTRLEIDGRFGEEIAKLKGDIVIDLICFTPESARQLVSAIGADVQQLIHCGTIWVYGANQGSPTLEDDPRQPLGTYGRDKAAIEQWLLAQAEQTQLPVAILHPGHIVGQGWTPLGPAGNFNPQIFDDIAAGKEVFLPNQGLEMLHHVHADDVAQAFIQAIKYPELACGESFNIVSDAALSLNTYALELARAFGKPSRVKHLALDKWNSVFSEEDYQASMEHLSHGSNCSNAKAKARLKFAPAYSSIAAIEESLAYRFNQ